MDLDIADIGLKNIPDFDAFDNLTKGSKIAETLLREAVSEEGLPIKTFHKKFNAQGQVCSHETFDLNENESEGTKKLVYFAGVLQATLLLHDHSIIIIDELDASLHPLITQSIIRLFNSPQNDKGAQLIFTTHDTNLLSNKNFRRDQIWFTEKDKYGATDLYSLAEYNVRNDASYEKDYIAGKYGAIPFIGSLDLRESGGDG